VTKKLSDILAVEEINPDDEWMLVSHMIMSDEVLEYCFKLHEEKHMQKKQFTTYFQDVYRWLMRHWKQYGKAPKKTIAKIFNIKKKHFNEDKAKIIESYLDRLAEEFIGYEERDIDSDFIKKTVIPRFIKRYNTQSLLEQLQKNLDQDQYDRVKDLVEQYHDFVDQDEFDPNMGVVSPGIEDSIKRYYMEEKDKGAMFKLNGPVGEFIGPFYRGKTYAITGVEKAGKTHFMSEIGYQGAWYHKLNVLDINLEMPVEEKEERFWQRSGGFAIDRDHAGFMLIPVFDCENNQFGQCEVRKRPLNKDPLLFDGDQSVSFYERPEWKVCERCRFQKVRSNAKRTKKFVPHLWFKRIRLKAMTENRLMRFMKQQEVFGLQNYRMKCFPRFSATFDEIERFIKQYMSKKNFKPDLILLDYPDILAPIEGSLMDRFNIDYNFKKVSGLSQELNCAMIIGDQAVKGARTKDSLDAMSTSESKTKDAHIDLRLTLNKTEIEHELGLQRLGMQFRRKGRLLINQVLLLQSLDMCNPVLDSTFYYGNSKTNFPVNMKQF
jgi:hypothetical protein